MRKITRKPLTLQARHTVKQTLARIRLRYNFRHRAAGENDFHRICKGEQIRLLRCFIPLKRVTGVHIYYKKVTFIYLNPALTGDEFLWVGFHELGHHFLHTGKGNPLHQFDRVTPETVQMEVEADLFAELILMRKVEVRFNA